MRAQKYSSVLETELVVGVCHCLLAVKAVFTYSTCEWYCHVGGASGSSSLYIPSFRGLRLDCLHGGCKIHNLISLIRGAFLCQSWLYMFFNFIELFFIELKSAALK